MPRPLRPIKDRFWEQVDRRGLEDCWPWLGTLDLNNYPRLFVSGHRRYIRATHLALEYAGRALQPGQIACHTCDNPPCCNPAHLFAGSHADNMADMVAKGRASTGDWTTERRRRVGDKVRAAAAAHPENNRERRKTHCPKGHPYDETNTLFAKAGRRCRACDRERMRLRWATR